MPPDPTSRPQLAGPRARFARSSARARSRPTPPPIYLVLVRHIVHQPGAERVFGKKRSLIDQTADVLRLLLTSIGDAAYQLLIEIAVERFVHLFVRARITLLGQLVHRSLVVADVMHV